jgi:hypothetical protein
MVTGALGAILTFIGAYLAGVPGVIIAGATASGLYFVWIRAMVRRRP